jgi:pSer/pThr/pTyr-binding forkhead associated (FHA) protein
MPVIQVNDKQHTLKLGQTRIGAGPGVDVSVSDDPALGVQAVLELAADSRVVIRRARDGANVRVNGVALAEPTPLIHGDKVDVAGTEVFFSEDKKVGATAFVSAKEVAGIAAKRPGQSRATGTTGGRIVSLVDGKEYQIPAQGITFGREAGSDVVVPQAEVSRKHASIAPGDNGYVIQDHSTNGIWVNGTRVQTSQLLARSDVVRVGSEEFRFYADLAGSRPTPGAGSAQAAPPSPPRPPAIQVAAAQASAPVSAPAAGAAERVEPPPVPATKQPEVSAAPTVPVATIPPPIEQVEAPTARVATMPPPKKREDLSSTPPTSRPQPVKQKREPATAARARKEEKPTGIPSWVWIAIIMVVGVAAYFLGQGRG